MRRFGTQLGIGIGLTKYSSRAGGNGQVQVPFLIASYRCYDKTNDDADRNVLTDLTGNGHDIQLYNFGFAEGSGYGLYSQNLTKVIQSSINTIVSKTYNKVRIETKQDAVNNNICLINSSSYNFNKSYKIRCYSDLKNLTLQFYKSGETAVNINININGVTDIAEQPSLSDRTIVFVSSEKQDGFVELEILPDYKGALVSDGVDDYGLCENFPILTKEKGYTVCAIRAIINTTNLGSILGNGTNYTNGSFLFEYYVKNETDDRIRTISFGGISELNPQPSRNISFIYQTKDKYNGKVIKAGNTTQGRDTLALFVPFKNGKVSSIALYALEIYDRDLTDEEIAKVKARMIAEYEAKTGNKYEEETA